MANTTKQISTITSGTITANDTKQDVLIIHDAIALATTLTLTMPASPTDGHKVSFVSTLGVTTLTMSSTPTIVGSLTTIAAAGFATWIYELSTNKWFRIG